MKLYTDFSSFYIFSSNKFCALGACGLIEQTARHVNIKVLLKIKTNLAEILLLFQFNMNKFNNIMFFKKLNLVRIQDLRQLNFPTYTGNTLTLFRSLKNKCPQIINFEDLIYRKN